MNKMAKEFNKCVNEAIKPYVELATKVIKDFNEMDIKGGNKNDTNNGNS